MATFKSTEILNMTMDRDKVPSYQDFHPAPSPALDFTSFVKGWMRQSYL
jgi:hypothetical protein